MGDVFGALGQTGTCKRVIRHYYLVPVCSSCGDVGFYLEL